MIKMSKPKSVTTVSIDTDVLTLARTRGFNISGVTEEALKQKLSSQAYISPEEKAELEKIKKEKEKQEAKVLERYKYLDDMKDLMYRIDNIHFDKKEKFLASEKPDNFSDGSPDVELWLETVDTLRDAGLKVGTAQLIAYWKYKKYGTLEG